jgi:HSP20 family molecular chaperone IbpA
MSSTTTCNDSRIPIAVQLISNLVQAPIRAAAVVVGSVADAVASCTDSLEQWSSARSNMPASGTETYPKGSTVNVGANVRSVRARGTVRVIEGDESYLAFVEVPTAEAGDILVRVAQNQVEVSAKTLTDAGFEQYPSIAIPEGVNHEGISADFGNGILTIHLPKEAKQFRREVKVHTTAAAKPQAPKV